LKAFGGRSLSASELMEKLELSHKPTFRSNYLHPAIEMGLVEMTVPDKPNSRLQKYRITRKGIFTMKAKRYMDFYLMWLKKTSK